jgi:Flp pilus assembly protein TadD
MTPTWRAVGQAVLVVAGGALLIWQLRSARRDRMARRATPETALRPARLARRRKANVRIAVLVGAVLAVAVGSVVLERTGSDETRRRMQTVKTLVSRGGLVLIGLTVLSVAVLFLMLWMKRDPALKDVAALASAGRTDDAIEALRRLMAERGETATRLTALGALYVDQKRWDDALEQFRRAEAKGAPQPATTNNVAVVLFKMGRGDEALALLAGAAAKHPRDFEVACNQAHILTETGREAEAYAALERAEDILDQVEPRYVPEHWKQQIEPLRQKLPAARGFPVVVGPAAAAPAPDPRPSTGGPP